MGSDVEGGAKLQRLGTVHDLGQRLLVNISEHGMEEAGADVPACLDDSGNPGGIAARGDVIDLLKVGAEVADDTAQLVRALNDESAIEIWGMLANELLDFELQGFDFVGGQGDAAGAIWRPAFGPVEGGRSEVRGKEGNGGEADRFGVLHNGSQGMVIGFLHRAAGPHRHIGAKCMQGTDAFGHLLECAWDTANVIVQRRGTVEGDDHVVYGVCDCLRLRLQ